MQNSDPLLKRLRTILLDDDRQDWGELSQDVEALKAQLTDENQREKLESFFGEKIDYMRAQFPDLFGKVLTQTIKKEIRDSREEMVDALYPIIGKLVSRYLKNEIEQLSQRIEERMDRTFTLKGFMNRLRAFFSGVKYEEMVMQEAMSARLEEVFVITQGSGMLLGQYSLNDLLDADMIAGMLSGIKSFVEHAFKQGQQELETLEYDNYKIVVHNFQTFFIASVLSGNYNSQMKSQLDKFVMDFCEEHFIAAEHTVTSDKFEHTSAALKEHFNGFNKVD